MSYLSLSLFFNYLSENLTNRLCKNIKYVIKNVL